MINLIPQAEKKKMARSFYFRLVVLFLFMMSISFLIILIAILPSYFLSSLKNNIADEKLAMQKKEPVPSPDQKTLQIIKDLNNKMALIESAKNNKFIVSEKVINAVLLKKMPSIEIVEISYENNLPKTPGDNKMNRKISIQGNAPSREILLLFRRALEDSASFKQVDLPISNFVKGSNIQFYLSLMPS